MKSTTNNCNQHLEFWRLDLKTKLPEIPPKNKHPKMFAFAIPCGFGSWFLLPYLPGFGLVKASSFLRGVTAVPGAIFWSKITIPRTETENILISGLPKPCDSSIYEGNPIVWLFGYALYSFLWREPYWPARTLKQCLGAQIEIFFPLESILDTQVRLLSRIWIEYDRIALTGSALKLWLRLL